MAETVIAASMTLDAGQATKSVKEFKDELKQAEKDYAILKNTVGETNAATLKAAENISKVKDQINIASDSAKGFKTRLREAQENLIKIQAQFGETSKEALAAAKGVANMRDQMKEAKEVSDLFDPGAKFQVFGNVLRTVAGGFSALTGTMALFGADSKEVEKQLLKVQAALAITEGVNTIVDSAKDFNRLKAVIAQTTVVKKVYTASTATAMAVTKALGLSTVVTSTGFKLLRGAIIATGIGALVVGVGLLIANFDKVKAAVLNLIPGLGKLSDFVGGIVNKITDFTGVTSEAERALNKFTKATARGNEDLENRIKILTAQGGKEAEVSKIRTQIAENDLNVLRNKLKVEGKLSDEELKQFRDLKNQKAVIGLEEQERLKKISEDAAKERSETAKKNSEEYKQKQEQAKKDREDRLKELTQELEDAKKFRAEMQAGAEDATVKLNELDASEVQSKKDLFNQRIANTRQGIQDEVNVMNELKYLQMDANRQQEADELLNLAAWYNERYELVKGNEIAEAELKDQYRAFESKIKKKKFEEDLQLIGAFLGQSANLLGRHTVAGKALAISEATISTFLSAQKAYASLAGIPIVGPALGAAAYGVAIAQGLKNIREIVKVKVPGGGGGGSTIPNISTSAPLSPNPQVQQTSTRIDQQSVNDMGNAAKGGVSRTYVLASDIKSEREKDARLERAAKLGG